MTTRLKNKELLRVIAPGLFLVIFLARTFAFGEEGGGAEEPAGIPRIVMYQALNFFALMILLFFILKNRITAHFNKRHDQLTSALREAKRVKEEADHRHQDYVLKLKKLQVESGTLLDQIRKEAEESKRRILEEAQRLAQSIEQEAKKTAANEVEKAKAELYDDILEQALEGARGLLSKSVADNDQRRLQKEFTDKIEAVQ